MFTKYATAEVLEIKTSAERLNWDLTNLPGDALAKFAKLSNEATNDDGYMYVRVRAISSRVNKNNDGWPSEELARSYQTFTGRPIFIDHNNDNPSRTRGVVVDSKLHVEDDEKISALDPYYASAPENHKPPTWIELLLEVDAKTFPKLAKEIEDGNIDAVSMGANIASSTCSVCANRATVPSDFCSHIKKKGATFEVEADNGERVQKKAYEDCYGVNFFEISFVFDPADETALKLTKTAELYDLNDETQSGENRELNYLPQTDQTTAPQPVDTLRNEVRCPDPPLGCGSSHLRESADGVLTCPVCGYEQPPEGLDNPDLGKAEDVDMQDGVELPDQAQSMQSIEPVSPVNRSTSTKGISDMDWKTIKSGARVDLSDAGISPDVYAALKREGLTCKVTYPDGRVTTPPKDSPMSDMMMAVRAKREGAESLTVDIESDNLERVLEILSATSTKPPRQKPTVINPGSERKTDQPVQERVVSDQTKPVTAGASTVTLDGKEYVLVPLDDKADTKAEKDESKDDVTDEKEEVKDDEKEKDSKVADRRTIKRQEEELEGGGVRRTEEILEESSDHPTTTDSQQEEESSDQAGWQEEETEETEEAEDDEYAYASNDNEQKLLAAFALAELVTSMGIVAADDKLAFVSEIEGESLAEIEARSKMLSRVKEAGLTKRRINSGRVATALPKLGNSSVDMPDIPEDDLISAVFWR